MMPACWSIEPFGTVALICLISQDHLRERLEIGRNVLTFQNCGTSFSYEKGIKQIFILKHNMLKNFGVYKYLQLH